MSDMVASAEMRSHREATQRMMRNIESEIFDPNNVDPRSQEDTSMFIDQMQAKLDNQINLLKAEKENELNKLKQTFDNELTRIAKGTRQLTISDFNNICSCDIVFNLRKNRETPVIPADAATTAAAAASSSASAATYSTPAMTRRNKLVEQTPRTLRRGEQITSQNGSPVDLYDEGTLVATVTKNRREPSMEIHVGQGKFFNIDDADGIKGATSGQKAAARDHLLSLRAQIDTIMAGGYLE